MDHCWFLLLTGGFLSRGGTIAGWSLFHGKSHGRSENKMDDDWGYQHDLGHLHNVSLPEANPY